MEISSAVPPFHFIPSFPETEGKAQPRRPEKEVANTTLSEEDQATIEKLRARDREVRAHEQAHAAAAGGLAKGGPSFTYQRGPDGRQYAVGGEVNIDTSAVSGDPEATIRKAQRIRAAALAPADPSAQDRAVAASATALEAQARQELQHEKKEEAEEEKASANSPGAQIDIFV